LLFLITARAFSQHRELNTGVAFGTYLKSDDKEYLNLT